MVNVLSNWSEVCVYCSGKWMGFPIYKLHLNHDVKSRTVYWKVSQGKISLGLPPHLGIKYKPRLMTNKWFFPRDRFVRIRWPCRIKGRRKGHLRLWSVCMCVCVHMHIYVQRSQDNLGCYSSGTIWDFKAKPLIGPELVKSARLSGLQPPGM